MSRLKLRGEGNSPLRAAVVPAFTAGSSLARYQNTGGNSSPSLFFALSLASAHTQATSELPWGMNVRLDPKLLSGLKISCRCCLTAGAKHRTTSALSNKGKKMLRYE